MRQPTQLRRLTATALLVFCCISPARAQGIPVIDIANLIQTILQVLNDVTEIANQVQQIKHLQDQVKSMNGLRNMGTVLNSAALHNYVPAQAYTVLNAVSGSGYSALSATAKALRDASMVYNCLDLSGRARGSCQAELAQPYQHKGMLQDAMRSAANRLDQIRDLMQQVNATGDQKAVLEVQARIGAENAMLAHEVSQIQMLQAMADSEERIARSRDRERQQQVLLRTGRIADYLH